MRYFLLFIFLVVINMLSKGQSEDEILLNTQVINPELIILIQAGNENTILSSYSDNSSLNLIQQGDNNIILAQQIDNSFISQIGDANQILIDGQIIGNRIIQVNDNNSLQSYGTNSIMENATIIQSGNQEVLIFNTQ